MAKDPAVLFYTSDFLTGTMTMSDEQVGKYIRLLCLQHQKKRLTEKDMMHICKSYDADIFDKFTQDDNGFYNKRMDDEAEKRRSYSLSRGNNRKNRNHMINISKSYDNHMENENENENENVIEDVNKNINTIKEKKTKNNKQRTLIPALDDVLQFAQSEGIGTHKSPQDFHDYYTSNGWKVGRQSMKDWKAAFRRWTRNEKNYEHGTHQQAPKGLSARTKSDWDALQEWGSPERLEQARVRLFGGTGDATT